MASVHLLSAASLAADPWDYAFDDLDRMRRSFENDRFGVHSVTDIPEQADIILFVENCDPIRHYFEVRRHPVYGKHREKCFLFSRHDYPVPFLPGVYASIPNRWYNPTRTRSGLYLNAFDHPFIAYDPTPTSREYLYSFIGQAGTHPLRTKVMDLPQQDGFLFDTTPYWPYADLPSGTQTALQSQYVDVARQSKFVLCPRGRGASSIRLFEMMRMGRAPVIISDDWVPPSGPDWPSFSIRVAEAELSRLPSLLRTRADEAEEMGLRARRCWEEWFSEEATFHRVVNWCLELKEAEQSAPGHPIVEVLPQLLHPLYLKALLRTARERVGAYATASPSTA